MQQRAKMRLQIIKYSAVCFRVCARKINPLFQHAQLQILSTEKFVK